MSSCALPSKQHASLEGLQSQLRADLEPIRPLRAERLCLCMASIFILVSIGLVWAIFGLRPDHQDLGVLWLWGPSLFEIAVALVALSLAMAESTPGRSPSSLILWIVAGSGVACHAATFLAVSPNLRPVAPAGKALLIGLRDFGVELCFGIPMVLVALWIAQRGFTARTTRVGLMAAFGAGLATDGIWRLFCPVSEPGHMLGSHTLAIAAVLGVGMLLGKRWRAQMVHSRELSVAPSETAR